MVSPYVRMLMLLIKPLITILRPILAQSLIRGALKNRNKIGKIGNPCGILVCISFISLILQFKVSEVSLSVKKLSTYLITQAGRPFILRLYIS